MVTIEAGAGGIHPEVGSLDHCDGLSGEQSLAHLNGGGINKETAVV